MGNGNRPTPEFRREAVRLALTSGRKRREIAEDLGVQLLTLTRCLSREPDVGEPSEAPVDVHAGRPHALVYFNAIETDQKVKAVA
jgi:transposase